jgi:hypothetical protein
MAKARFGGRKHKGHKGKRRGKGFQDFWRTLNNPKDWGRAIAHEVTNSDSDLRKKVIPGVKQVIDVVKSLAGGRHKKHKKHHKRR